ncbi:MAG TPA: exodeoxyribonuclease VII large subunit [Cyclobacteriaceae bacterium]|nr:exodeoxyribonuclease VII large subunit [Cyclobacteriaceae bacterium]
MSETVNDKRVFTLFEVARSIQKTLNERYKSSFWVKAEIGKLNLYHQSGHCYPELVEKQEGKVICQLKSTLWQDDYLAINDKFIQTLKEPLKDGIKVLAMVRITFDASHGLALNILDIDPAYSLGDLEREKQETIVKLKQEGIYEKNKTLRFPLLPQRIAIISVETSKGYADFLSVIDHNEWRYKFFHLLFPAILQGEKAVEGIIWQLKRIRKVIGHFDVVAIVRGGGGDIGLSVYNNFRLAKEVALFPIPVITGIGHATNETVVELISFSNAITPTKLGDFLIQRFHNFSDPVEEAEAKIVDRSRRLLSDENSRFHSEVKLFRSVTGKHFSNNRYAIDTLKQSLVRHSLFVLRNEKEDIRSIVERTIKGILSVCNAARYALVQAGTMIKKDIASIIRSRNAELINLEKNVSNMSPENVLRRGYSITLLNSKAVKTVEQIKDGDILSTIVLDGNITSAVKSVNTSKQ